MSLPPDLAHRLQNLMAIIVGYANLLEEELAPDDPKRADVAEIRQAAATAGSLILEYFDSRPD